MSDYTIKEFIEKFNPSKEFVKWALAECTTMPEVFAKAKPEWRIWIAARPGIMSKKDLILWACRCIKKTPLHDGGTVWDLLTDKRSKRAVKLAKKYAKGKVSFKVMEEAARSAASAAIADPTAGGVLADEASTAIAHAVYTDHAARAVVYIARAVVYIARAAVYVARAAVYTDHLVAAHLVAAQKFQSDLLNKYELNFSKKE